MTTVLVVVRTPTSAERACDPAAAAERWKDTSLKVFRVHAFMVYIYGLRVKFECSLISGITRGVFAPQPTTALNP